MLQKQNDDDRKEMEVIKYIMFSVIIAIMLCIGGCTGVDKGEFDSMSIQDEKFDESGVIDFQLLESYEVDTNGIREWLDVVEGNPFTFFFQYSTLKSFEDLSLEQFNLDLSEVDFNGGDYQDKFIAITIGRKLVEMQYEYLGEPYDLKFMTRADITFSEEYNNQVLYIYTIDKISLDSPFTGENAFYVLNGTEKVYLGSNMHEINRNLK